MNNIKRMMKILTPRQREVIYYRFIEELSYDDICQIMGLNYQSAYNLCNALYKNKRSLWSHWNMDVNTPSTDLFTLKIKSQKIKSS